MEPRSSLMSLLALLFMFGGVARAEALASGNMSNTIQIGFLVSFRHGLGKIIAGAIPYAIASINA